MSNTAPSPSNTDSSIMSNVQFEDEDHALEDGEMQVDFGDSASLIGSQMDAIDNQMYVDSTDIAPPPRRQQGRLGTFCLCLIPIVVAVGVGLAFATIPKNDSAAPTGTMKLSPPDDLATRCATPSLECKQACEAADCCDFPSNLKLSCLVGNEDACLTYHQACSIMTESKPPEPSATTIPTAPPNLSDICSADKITSVDGFMECQEACQAASCCYMDDETTCSNDECTAYAPCLALDASDNVHPDIKPHIEDECRDLTTVDGRSNCRLACAHAVCCFTTSEPGNRLLDSSCPQEDDSFCTQYDPCNDLERDINVEASAQEVSEVCNSDQTSLCEVVCERGACCFSSERCPESSGILCDDYGPCAVLYGETQDDDAQP